MSRHETLALRGLSVQEDAAEKHGLSEQLTLSWPRLPHGLVFVLNRRPHRTFTSHMIVALKRGSLVLSIGGGQGPSLVEMQPIILLAKPEMPPEH